MAYAGSTQEIELSLARLPLRNGYIYRSMNRTAYCLRMQEDEVFIQSKKDSCFATTTGVVVNVFDLGDEFATLVKSPGKKFYAYAGFSKVFVQKGDSIQRASFMGLLLLKESEYELTYIVSDKKGRTLSRQKLLQYLKELNTQQAHTSPAL